MQKHTIMRCMLGWAGFCLVFLCFSVDGKDDGTFFRFGPNSKLSIFSTKIDSAGKYLIVVMYTIVSTVVRTLQQEIISPWVIQNVQNDKPKDDFTVKYAQEISLGECIYRWFDWFMYMNILLAQVDMMIIELFGNLICVYYVTRMYIQNSSSNRIPSPSPDMCLE
jgi:hypothetical protein